MAGSYIIAPPQSNSSRLHRPWRSISSHSEKACEQSSICRHRMRASRYFLNYLSGSYRASHRHLPWPASPSLDETRHLELYELPVGPLFTRRNSRLMPNYSSSYPGLRSRIRSTTPTMSSPIAQKNLGENKPFGESGGRHKSARSMTSVLSPTSPTS